MRTQPELRNVEFAVRRQTLDAVQRPVVDVLLASWHLVVPGVEFVLSDQMMNWLTESRDQIPSQAHACTCVILQLDIKVSSSVKRLQVPCIMRARLLLADALVEVRCKNVIIVRLGSYVQPQ
jgi:hypothetical protein